jgi:hypothetical protein
VTLLSLFLIAYVTLALIWEDFTYFDNVYFTLVTLQHQNIWIHIYPESGRYFPLAHQEFNLIRHFAATFSGYQVFRIAQLLIMCGLLLALDEDLSFRARASLAIFALICPAIAVSFGGLIYTEWNVLFWLLLLLNCVRRFERTQSVAWAAGAVVCAQFMLYYKETSFVILAGFAIGRLLLRCRNDNEEKWNFLCLKSRSSRLDWCFVSLSLLFLLVFAMSMYPHFGTGYRTEIELPLSRILRLYIKLDPLAWFFAVFVLWRTFRILNGKSRPLPYWDGLAYGGVACMTSYLVLKIYANYYLAAVDLIAVLYLGHFAVKEWPRTKPALRFSLGFLFCVVLFCNILGSAYHFYERKNLIHGRALIADKIKQRYSESPDIEQRLFFSSTQNTVNLVSFASYLTYLGVPIAGSPIRSGGHGGVVFVVKGERDTNRCADYISYVCESGTAPVKGDLLIGLPDDYQISSEWGPYEKKGQVILSYQPYPHIPSWLYLYFGRFHATSRILPSNKFPDRWLQGSIVQYR